MKRNIVAILLTMCAAAVWAVPAKREWRVMRQADGTSVELMLVGDEHFHYYMTRDSVPVVEHDGGYYYAKPLGFALKSSGVLAHEASQRTTIERSHLSTIREVNSVRHLSKRFSPRRIGEPDRPPFVGSKRGLIILANFVNQQFEGYREEDMGDSLRLVYDSLANMPGYTNQFGAIGSVHDYFSDQSLGMFDLTFDVFGPVNLDKTVNYYGRNVANSDVYAPEMIIECCQAIDSLVDFSIYDWDGDGMVEEVFVLYAGRGEATGGGANTIWPHMWTMDEARLYNKNIPDTILFDGVEINVYACSNEIYQSGIPMGLGTFCHEFSHCLGLPDFYDTGYSGNFGMGTWSVLDQGSYNGPLGIGWVPSGYTSYERHFAGWLDYTVLSSDTVVTDMRPINDSIPEAFIIYNDSFPTEYYLLENRQKVRWDEYLPGEGLLILHVDYSEKIWNLNEVNTTGVGASNKHERLTIFHANNSKYDGHDAYPYQKKDSLTDNSRPKAILYNPNVDGTFFMHKPITHIMRNDSTSAVSFTFRNMAVRPDSLPADTTDYVMVRPMTPTSSRVSVYTSDGQLVISSIDRNRLEGLRPGLYVLRREDGLTEKVVINH